MKYRRDIDGLRAVAVLSVIFYHMGMSALGVDLFKGGFLGVDIFFVISGYLICGIILREQSEGRFTFRNFYERRARRILPMLFVVMCASIPFAWKLMFPSPFLAYAKSMLTSIFFSSNFQFWREGGYAMGANALKPFLHTWSLSIEEQFYLFFPVILIFFMRIGKRHIQAIFSVGLVASLGIAQWLSHKNVSADFYLLPGRGWELLAGAIVAKLHGDGRRAAYWAQISLPTIGLIFIAVSIALFNDTFPHPSLWTVPTVLGAALILFAGSEKDWGGRLLSFAPMRFIGLVSYSMYLWHQPVFAFARLYSINELTAGYKTGLLILVLVLSVASWKFVETPFRNKERVTSGVLAKILLSVCAVIVCFAGYTIFTNGFVSRFDYPIFSQIDKQQKDLLIVKDGTACHERQVNAACRLGNQSNINRWVIVGDSHMGYLSTVLWKALEEEKASLLILTKGGCPYTPNLILGGGEKDHPCQLSMNTERREVLLHEKPSVVVLGGRLPYYLSDKPFNNLEGGVELKQGNASYKLHPAKEMEPHQEAVFIKRQIRDSILELLKAGHKVVLIYPEPEMGWDPLETIKKKYLTNSRSDFEKWMKSGGVNISYSVFKQRQKDAAAIYDSVGTHPNLYRVYPEKMFCNVQIPNRCVAHTQDSLYYADQDHLSTLGNRLLVEKILSAVN